MVRLDIGIWDPGRIEQLRSEVLDRKKAKLETERVLICNDPAIMKSVIAFVQECQEVFVTPDHPDIAPILPEGSDVGFAPALEITQPRERYYFLDLEGALREADIEVRQELKPGGFYRQTVKKGNGATEEDSTMDRWEQASSILSFGFNAFAIRGKKLREPIIEGLVSEPKPVLRMLSQRWRIPYHPEGNHEVLIEMAVEPLHMGQTYTGHVWNRPKIDLEIIRGPDESEEKARHDLLAREERRLLECFPALRPQLHSSPSSGFDIVQEELKRDDGKRQFERINPRERWGNGLM